MCYCADVFKVVLFAFPLACFSLACFKFSFRGMFEILFFDKLIDGVSTS